MSNSWVTRCPGCSTCFRVGDAQLEAAGGLVRCGACLQVFMALENLLQPEFPDLERATESEEEEPAYSDPAHADEPRVRDEEDLEPDFEPDPEPVEEELESPLPEQVDWQEPGEPDRLDQNGAEQSTSAVNVEQAEEEGEADNCVDSLPQADPLAPQSAAATYEVPELTQFVDEEALTEEERSALHEALGFVPEEEITSYPAPPAIAQWLGWLVLNLVLIFALLVQYGWFNRSELSQRESLRGPYETLCREFGCLLPDFVDIDRLAARNLVVRSHPEVPEALVVDAILYNESAYPQPFPMLDLSFADIDNNRIAARRFRPDEYLRGEVASYRKIPGRTEVRLSLEIVDPGESAVSYQLEVVGI